jgi:DNA-binding MarR family transcriptional regulator
MGAMRQMTTDMTAPGVEDPASWVIPELLLRFNRAISDLNRCEPRHEGGLSTQQIRALLYFVHHDGRTIKELAHALSVSEARASRLADELSASGHVVSQRDSADRRQVRLYATPAASQKARRIYRQRMSALEGALGGASAEELEIFTRLLGGVVEQFEQLARQASEE